MVKIFCCFIWLASLAKIGYTQSDTSGKIINPITGALFAEEGLPVRKLIRSTDNGAHWTVVYEVKDPEILNPGYFFVDTKGTIFFTLRDKKDAILYSTDDGNTWTTLMHTPSYYKYASCKDCDAVTGAQKGNILSDGKGRIFYAPHYDGKKDKGVLYTNDNGKKWNVSPFWKKVLGSKSDDIELSNLIMDSHGNLYCGINILKDKTHKHQLTQNTHQWYIAHGFYIARSTDNGEHWDYITSFIDGDGHINEWGMKLAKLRVDADGNIDAETPSGKFHSDDGGKSFEKQPF